MNEHEASMDDPTESQLADLVRAAAAAAVPDAAGRRPPAPTGPTPGRRAASCGGPAIPTGAR